jgi:lipopolysaccharide export system permease protein
VAPVASAAGLPECPGGSGVKILDRYLIRQFLSTFILLLLALPFLFLITDVTDQLDVYLGRGVRPSAVALSYVYYMPQLIFWGFPIAALVATVFTIGNMTRHQEISAAKAGGISFYRMSAPILILAAILSVMAVAVGELVPVTNLKKAEVLGERDRFASPYRMNLVFRTEDGQTLSASRLNAETNEMTNVVFEGRNAADSIWVHRAANSARWGPDEGWTLIDGYVRWVEDEGDSNTMKFFSLQVPDLQEEPTELLATAKAAEEMRYAELQKFIGTVERSGGDPAEFEVNLAQRLSLPLALFVIVLFGAPLATSSQRGGTAFGVGISLAVTMIYLMMFKVGQAVGESGAIDPLVAAWTPNVLFLAAGIFLLWRVRT